MATAALLQQLLTYKNQKVHAEMEQIKWTGKYDINADELKHFTKIQDKWDKAYDKAFELDDGKTLKTHGITFSGTAGNEAACAKYAAAVTGWTEDKLQYVIDELTDLDCEYDQRKACLETEITELDANIEATKQELATSAQEKPGISG